MQYIYLYQKAGDNIILSHVQKHTHIFRDEHNNTMCIVWANLWYKMQLLTRFHMLCRIAP